MSMEQLEKRVQSLEEQVTELRRQLKPLLPMGSKFAENPKILERIQSTLEDEDQQDRAAE